MKITAKYHRTHPFAGMIAVLTAETHKMPRAFMIGDLEYKPRGATKLAMQALYESEKTLVELADVCFRPPSMVPSILRAAEDHGLIAKTKTGWKWA